MCGEAWGRAGRDGAGNGALCERVLEQRDRGDEAEACGDDRGALVQGGHGYEECAEISRDTLDEERGRHTEGGRVSSPVLLPDSVESLSVSLHPSFGLHGFPQMLPLIRESFKRPLRGAKRPPLSVKIGATAEDLKYVLGHTPFAVMDLETDQNMNPDLISFGDARDPRLIWVARWSDAIARAMEEWVKEADHAIAGHNFAFDFDKLENKVGLTVNALIADTMLACALLLPAQGQAKRQRWFSLEVCTLRYVAGWPAWKPTRKKSGVVDWTYANKLYKGWFPQVPEWNYEELYCGIDSGATGYLAAAAFPMLRELGMWELYKDVVCPCIPVLTRMTARGVQRDPERCELLKKQVERNLERATLKVQMELQEIHDKRIQRLQSVRDDFLARSLAVEGSLVKGCEVHPKYVGRARPRSTKAECECGSVFERNTPAWGEIRDCRKQAARQKEILKRIGDKFDVGNPNSWRWLLYEEMRVNGKPLVPPPSTVSDKGTPSVQIKALEALLRKYEGYEELKILKDRMVVAHALHRWNPKKGTGTLAVEEGEDGRVHYQFSLHKSPGRVASGTDEDEDGKDRLSPGNGLNIMKPDRSMFVASPGNVFLSRDFSQIEARIVAWNARDIAMLRALKEGKDTHCMTAALMFGVPMERHEETKKNLVNVGGRQFTQRYIIKKVRHGKNYGMGVQRAVDETGLPFAVVADAFAADDRMWPDVARWQRAIKEKLAKDRMLVNAWGRIHRAYGFKYNKKTKSWEASHDTIKEGLASGPQTEASEILKSVLPELWRMSRSLGAWIVLPPHDQVLVDCPMEKAREWAAASKEIMEREWPQLGVIPGHEEEFGLFSCPTDLEVGMNWGEKHTEHGPECEEGCLLNPEGMEKVEWDG